MHEVSISNRNACTLSRSALRRWAACDVHAHSVACLIRVRCVCAIESRSLCARMVHVRCVHLHTFCALHSKTQRAWALHTTSCARIVHVRSITSTTGHGLSGCVQFSFALLLTPAWHRAHQGAKSGKCAMHKLGTQRFKNVCVIIFDLFLMMLGRHCAQHQPSSLGASQGSYE